MPIASMMPPVGSWPALHGGDDALAAAAVHGASPQSLMDTGVGENLHLAVVEGHEDQHPGFDAGDGQAPMDTN